MQNHCLCVRTSIGLDHATACEVGIFFSREISQLLKMCPPSSLRSHLSSSPMQGRTFGDYGITSPIAYFVSMSFVPKLSPHAKRWKGGWSLGMRLPDMLHLS